MGIESVIKILFFSSNLKNHQNSIMEVLPACLASGERDPVGEGDASLEEFLFSFI